MPAPKRAEDIGRKLDPQQPHVHAKKHSDATPKEFQKMFGVSHHAVWVRRGQPGFTLKNP
jgi:hypothetical protein